jgi:hypothetical protein
MIFSTTSGAKFNAANSLSQRSTVSSGQSVPKSRKIASGEFRTLFWVSPGIPAGALGAYFRALRRADVALRANQGKYMPLWKKNIPRSLHGDYDWSKFGLGEMLVFERYPEETFDQTMQFARRWGLDKNVREESYSELAAPVSL